MKWICASTGTGGEDLALAGDDLGPRSDEDVDPRLGIRVAGLADPDDAAVLDPDIGLDDPPMIQNQGIGDDQVDHLVGLALALAHAVADDLAAAELHLVAVVGTVLLDLDEELGVAQAHAVPDRRTVHGGIGRPADLAHVGSPSSAPITRPLKP
jgi:hypothetical protein